MMLVKIENGFAGNLAPSLDFYKILIKQTSPNFFRKISWKLRLPRVVDIDELLYK